MAEVAVPDAAPVAEAPPPVTDLQPAGQPAQDNTLAWSLLGLVGLGAAGALVLRRRRRDGLGDKPAVAFEPPVVARPVLKPALTREFEPASTRPTGAPTPAYAFSAPAAETVMDRVQPQPAAAAATSSAAMIPPGPLPRGEALVALFDRMVHAAPDADNPFTSNKARRKRVRMLMTKHENRLRTEATRPFDYRTYQPVTALDAEDEQAKPTVSA